VTNRGLLILGLGAALVGIGLVALNFPIFLDAYDQWGVQVKCGTGYSTNLSQAEFADQTSQSNFVGQCQSALATWRAWTIPVAVAGWLVLSAALVAAWRHTSPHVENAGALR
jgi:hypothetical protein